MRFFRLIFLTGVLCAALTDGSNSARAHAIVVESTPAVDAAIKGSNVVLRLRFNSRIDQERSRLTLNGGGKTWPLTSFISSKPEILEAKATGLPTGSYTLHWQVLAVDGHITRGDIPFHVTP
jgi:methionine-rich copper-binding protein CopC